MECYKIENVSFTYPGAQQKALDGVTAVIHEGEFITLCGKSGCGKTTLLRLLKPALAPTGALLGSICFNKTPLAETDAKTQASKIGFVMQDPDNQIVCDKVWHELAFGLESTGVAPAEIRTRVAEMASFFGIQTWFHKKVDALSGGQKQLLNLASVMVMRPRVLILDEPTSQLDPIASQEFLNMLERINRELGTTVILSEHRLEDVFPISDRVLVLDDGKLVADGTPQKTAQFLKETNHEMSWALPAPMRICAAVDARAELPLTVRDGRAWLLDYKNHHTLSENVLQQKTHAQQGEPYIKLSDVYFRYEKNLPDVIKGLSLKIYKGELFSILGGNATGKTTLLSLLSGINTEQRGKILFGEKPVKSILKRYRGMLGVLPQAPQTLFVKKTVRQDLFDMIEEHKLSEEEGKMRVGQIALLCRISHLLDRHPYDLSGGEQQRAALAKVLLGQPQVLLLDEPTKGMDAHFKETFGNILHDLKKSGITVIMVSHDIEFCAEHMDRCALMFDGQITAVGTPQEFFAENTFYTTSANRMAHDVLPLAVTANDVIAACGKAPAKKDVEMEAQLPISTEKKETMEKQKKHTPLTIALGIGFFIFFFVLCAVQLTNDTLSQNASILLQLLTIVTLSAGLLLFVPQKKRKVVDTKETKKRRRWTRRDILCALFVLFAIPLTILFGMYFLEDRKYYFISILMIIEILVPFFIAFEGRAPKARDLVTISVLCALAVSGRMVFSMLPQFKPILAIVVICGVCFGGETGFLVGAVAGFVSNFFFGQGPWTPWQMFALGIVGFLAGVFFHKGLFKSTKLVLCVFGALVAVFVYGGILNTATVLMMQDVPTLSMIVASITLGLPFDLVNGAATAFFLWFLSEPMIQGIERIQIKYGLNDL